MNQDREMTREELHQLVWYETEFSVFFGDLLWNPEALSRSLKMSVIAAVNTSYDVFQGLFLLDTIFQQTMSRSCYHFHVS
jgi:hypothetical protein